MKRALLLLILAASQAAHADDLADAASAELALSNAHAGTSAADVRLRPGGATTSTRAMTTPKSAAAILYPPPPGFKTPKTNPARAHDIYKSPY
jgi:hypothetical protein